MWAHKVQSCKDGGRFHNRSTKYYYLKNVQGDITAIYDEAGNLKAEYEYDAWGNHVVTLDVGGIGSLNPFRYRSYYFDEETGLYYLQSRYYDPAVGRFINADAYVPTLNRFPGRTDILQRALKHIKNHPPMHEKVYRRVLLYDGGRRQFRK